MCTPGCGYAANLRLSFLSSCSTVESRRSVSRGVIEFRLTAPASRVWYALRSRAESLPRKARALGSTLMVIVSFFALAIFERIRAVAFQSIERSFSFGCFIDMLERVFERVDVLETLDFGRQDMGIF